MDLLKKSSKQDDRERALLYVLMFSGEQGDVISRALKAFGPVEGFRFLRRMSGLRIRLPDDAGVLSDYATPEQLEVLSVGTNRCDLEFPRFMNLLELMEQVRCYFLYKKVGSTMAAHMLGWAEQKVRKVSGDIGKKVKGVESLL